MSSRTSDFGTLAQRSARAGVGAAATRAELPCHVWVRGGGSWLPGVLVPSGFLRPAVATPPAD
ncbi:hypothetical protein AAEX63_15370 [Luteococcus sp. H138]|uniref:hypothetical protein n=1 Tax=unclassified Luteococcus TaxID=2639923 RepID=UPI00313E5085